MLRIHFTAADLARTRVAPTVGAAAETYHGLGVLRGLTGGGPFRQWRTEVAARLGPEAGPLAALLPVDGPGLDLATLVGATDSAEEGAENLLRVGRVPFAAELSEITYQPRHRAWARSLASGDPEARKLLARSFLAVHRTAVAPYWPQLTGRLEAVRAGYACAVLEGGVDGLLASLAGPLVRWRPPVLEVANGSDRDFHLAGRGLVLAPTFFAWGVPRLLWDPADDDQPVRLSLPAADRSAPVSLHPADPAAPALGALLGRTRAAALRATAGGCNTSQLAARLNVTPAAASQHAKVLREAHLITSSRRGGSVLHRITALGEELLGRQ
ncbi:winged helix-turn-helix domain-containing protein [Kitasatospora sp. NPDC096147]|uniref:helix-turn-helix domain-containing protein n=1 Tax=Kitasatospora sp. NPDC096147 TaxID=3364093 RepID=UPI003800EDD1